MKTVTLDEWSEMPDGRTGIWTCERNDQPEWKAVGHLYMGKRTMLDYDPQVGTVLLVEGLSLEIVE